MAFLKRHLRDMLLGLKTANGTNATVVAAAAEPAPGGVMGRARGDSISSVHSDFGDGLGGVKVEAAEFDALGFLLAGGRDCEAAEAPRLSELVPFWQVWTVWVWVWPWPWAWMDRFALLPWPLASTTNPF